MITIHKNRTHHKPILSCQIDKLFDEVKTKLVDSANEEVIYKKEVTVN